MTSLPDSLTPPAKAVLVTGAAKRIGRVIAETLAADGWAVAVHCATSYPDALAVVSEIIERGGVAVAVTADLADEAQMAGVVAEAARALGQPITALVNNASVFAYDSALGATRASWDYHMDVNLRAPFVLTQELVRQLPSGIEGAVVNIIDQRVWNLGGHFTSYTLSKAGLWTLTQTLALALAPRVRVNAVGPGPTLPSVRQTEQSFAKQVASLPLQRAASPLGVADAVRFLLAAPSVTGQMIAVDGGQHLGQVQVSDDPGE